MYLLRHTAYLPSAYWTIYTHSEPLSLPFKIHYVAGGSSKPYFHSKRNPFFVHFFLLFSSVHPVLVTTPLCFNMATNENGYQNYMVQDEDNDTEGEEERVRRVSKTKDQPPLETAGWFSFQDFLSNNSLPAFHIYLPLFFSLF
jgi:hypothetical protein